MEPDDNKPDKASDPEPERAETPAADPKGIETKAAPVALPAPASEPEIARPAGSGRLWRSESLPKSRAGSC